MRGTESFAAPGGLESSACFTSLLNAVRLDFESAGLGAASPRCNVDCGEGGGDSFPWGCLVYNSLRCSPQFLRAAPLVSPHILPPERIM